MDLALLAARLLLAAVFAVASMTKFADLPGSRRAVRDFGVPGQLATPFGVLLPLVELAVAVALIPKASARYGALGALMLLILFVLGIATTLARGRRPDCHCFGQLHSSPIGWTTLARNAVLAAVAAFVAWWGWNDPGSSAVAWAADLSTAERLQVLGELVTLGFLAALGWAVIHLLGQNGRLLRRLDALEVKLSASGGAHVPAPAPAPTAAPEASELGLPVGAPAPAFSLPGLYGETLTLDALRAPGTPVVLIFSDPGCGPCNGLLPDIGRWEREHADRITVALVSRGTPEANLLKSTEHGVSRVLLQRDFEVAEAYQATGTPIGVIIRPDGRIGSQLAPGADAVRALVARTLGGPDAVVPAPLDPTPAAAPTGGIDGSGPNGNEAQAMPSVAEVGDKAPLLTFPSLTGSPMGIGDFRGHRTLVLFWNPGCGFCMQMLEDLKAWEANRPVGAPKLLVISAGTEEANRALGIHAPIVLDQGFEAGRAFGASGTPSAVLVDAQGRVASEVAVGAEAVLALATRPEVRGPADDASGNGTVGQERPKVGDAAPPLKLSDLTGKTIDLKARRGIRTLILFWNPGCGFCQRMLDDLKAWEMRPPKGAPKLLVVSTGTPEANAAMGLRSPVVLDQGFRAGSAFGASGTPSAVLVDAKGNIASEVAVGAPAALALAGVPRQQPARS